MLQQPSQVQISAVAEELCHLEAGGLTSWCLLIRPQDGVKIVLFHRAEKTMSIVGRPHNNA